MRCSFARSLVAGLAATAFSPCTLGQPANDNCENALYIAPCASLNGTTVGATRDSTLNCTPFAWYDVWYYVEVPGAGTLRVYTCPTALDTTLELYSGCPSAGGARLECNDDHLYCGTAYPWASYVARNVLSPQVYLIRIAGTSEDTGTFTLNTEFTPSNDRCSGAPEIGDGTRFGANICADTDGSACALSGADVWYLYTPRCSGTLDVFSCPASYDTVISVHSGCPGTAGNQLACNDDSAYCGAAYPNTSFVAVPVEGQQTYVIRVSGWNGTTGSFILNTHLNVAPPANDNCGSAIPVSDGDTPFATCNATTDGPAESLCFPINPEIELDVWYRYTALCSGSASVSLCASNFDTRLAVYNGNCPSAGGQAIACDDDSCVFDERSYLVFSATAGQQYLIRIGGGSVLARGSGTMVITSPACCDGDVNSDGDVNLQDLATLLAHFGTLSGATLADGDLDGNGTVDLADLAILLAHFGSTCP